MNSNTPRIDDLLRLMVAEQASDLHLKPMRPPLLRVNGKLTPLDLDPLDPEAIPGIIDSIMPDRLREPLETNLAADFGYSLHGVSRFRVSVFQQRGTRSAIFRRVPFEFPSLEDWGLPSVLHELTELPQGLVLITGPTGSGKSSTLAAMMRRIADTRLVHIVTIEDPIEFILGDSKGAVTQREIGTDTPGFELALRNALRQDPDVIMVGEMRDQATIQTVLTASETGHLVFSTLHTNSATQTIDRIIDSFPPGHHRQVRQQLSSVLQAVVSMRLVEAADGNGMVAAVEILRRAPRLSRLILEGNLDAVDEEIERSVSYERMQSMTQSLAALVINGAIKLETALACSDNPGDLDLMLRKFVDPAAERETMEGDPTMAEPLSDFSKILELQEIKRLYEEQQERHASELSRKEEIIADLQQQIDGQQASAQASAQAETGETDELRREKERLEHQVQAVRDEYETKIERLTSRVRDLSAAAGRAGETTEPERRGFFRR